MWRTAVYLLGDGTSYHRLASLWRGIHAGDDSLPEPVSVWDIPDVVRLAANCALPDASLPDKSPGHFVHRLAFQTLLTSKSLSAYFQLPELETSGFAVNMIPDFDTVPNIGGTAATITLGNVVARTREIENLPYTIAVDDLSRHVFVSGVTGMGKPTRSFASWNSVASAVSPFLVIEPAKTKYRALLKDSVLAKRLQIFTLGDEQVSPFRLNPFEVMPGVRVGLHLDLLRSVFSVSFGMWTPLPQVLEPVPARRLHR